MREQPGRGRLLGDDLTGVPPEEVRFGVVLDGGVSLAVWTGGVALELAQVNPRALGVAVAAAAHLLVGEARPPSAHSPMMVG